MEVFGSGPGLHNFLPTTSHTSVTVLTVLILITRSIAQLPQCVMRQSSTCTCDLSFDMGYIDLTPLARNDGKPQFSINTGQKYSYFYNPCYSFNGGCSGDVAVCQTVSNANCGKQSTGSISVAQTSQPFVSLITYTGGAENRLSIVRLICDQSKDNPEIKFDGENPKENYHFNLTSKWCCPQPNIKPTGKPVVTTKHHPEEHKISLGTILDISLLLVLLAYFTAGVLFMRLRRGATGRELIPNLSFWTSLPGLIKDGGKLIFSKVCRCLPQKGGYSNLN